MPTLPFDASAVLLRAISDSSEDAIFAKDREGRLRFANPATLALVGKRLHEVLGATDLEILEDKDAARRVMENDRRIMESGTAEEVEETVPMPGGARRLWLSRKTPYRDASGEVVGLLGIARDITQRTRQRDALAESERRLAFIVQFAPAFMAVLRGPRHVFEMANEKYFEVVGRRDVLGKPVLEALPEIAGSPFPELLDHVYQHGVPFAGNDVALRLGPEGDAQERWVDFVYLPLREPDGSPSGVFVHGVDITARKRIESALRDANERLADSDRRKTAFLAMLSHELRNPLAPIRNAIYLMERGAAGGPSSARALAVLDRQTSHLTRMVDDLLDVTRIERGKVELHRVPLDLREEVRQACEDHRPLFEASRVALSAALDGPPAWVDADPTRLSQVLGNLLQNAAKFTPAGGRVTVELTASDGAARIAVRDTGAGIAPADLTRIFEPFTQSDQSLARTRGGLGLGLSLVKGLVELHGGSVVARSEGSGRGSELVVTLPRTAAPPVSHPAPDAGGNAQPLRILVIEDNEDAASSLAELLELDGHAVEVAHDGPSGVARALATRPEVVLCDLGLPLLDGYGVARALRAEPSLSGTLLVALSGYAQPEDRRRSREAGFDRHFPKPPPLDELTRLLAERAAAKARGEAPGPQL